MNARKICVLLLFFLLALLMSEAGACPAGTQKKCKEAFLETVQSRAEAIELAFGILFNPERPRSVTIVKSKEFGDGIGDWKITPDELQFRKGLAVRADPGVLRFAKHYWPLYNLGKEQGSKTAELQKQLSWMFQIDAALHHLLLVQYRSWLLTSCQERMPIEELLPCKMAAMGLEMTFQGTTPRIVNENRIKDVWPEDLDQFTSHWERMSQERRSDFLREGGTFLVPKILSHGTGFGLIFLMTHPFKVEGNNFYASAQAYQSNAERTIGEWKAKGFTIADIVSLSRGTPEETSDRQHE